MSFRHAILHELIRLPFELKLISDELTHRKKLKTFSCWLFYNEALLRILLVPKSIIILIRITKIAGVFCCPVSFFVLSWDVALD